MDDGTYKNINIILYTDVKFKVISRSGNVV